MGDLHLSEVEAAFPPGQAGDDLRRRKAVGEDLPGILHLIFFRPDATKHLLRFTDIVMRGESPLSHGQRELIASLVSRGNGCMF